MSANINENKRVFTVGEAWHKLGTVVETEQTAENAVKLAQLDYNVVKSDLFTQDKRVDSHVAIIREDTQEILGITTPKYKIVQNVNAFSFFDTVVGEGQAIYHSAGALGKGERIWILAKLPSNIVVGKDDTLEKYLCLTTSHDGKSSLKMYFTPIRVVCQNTLNMSMSDSKNGISIRHSGDIKRKVDEAREILNISIDYYKQYEQIVNQFEEKPLMVSEVEKYFEKVLAFPEDEVSTRKENQKNTLLHLFEYGKGQQLGNKHSLWKAYNSVTEYVDHHSSVKNLSSNPSNKLSNIWFGNGAKIKQKAWEQAKELLTV